MTSSSALPSASGEEGSGRRAPRPSGGCGGRHPPDRRGRSSRALRPCRLRRPCRRRPGHRPSAARRACDLGRGERRSGDEGALDDDVLVLGKRPRQGPASIIEAEEAAGIGPRRPLVGLVPGGRRELADLLGRPVRRLFGQPCVGLGLGHFDEGLHLVERELPLGQGISDLGERRELGGGGDPFAAVAAETPHRWTSQATMEVAPSTRHARRRSSSATAARSWL